jgi:hypothetical protein
MRWLLPSVPTSSASWAAVGGAGTEAGQALLRDAAKRTDEGRKLYQREQKRLQRARAKQAEAEKLATRRGEVRQQIADILR